MLNRSERRRSDSPTRRTTILIVTDDGDLGAASTRVLEQAGYDVVTAPHAGHAFLAALTRTRIDVLISDMTLDDMSGETLAATLRRYHRGLQGVYITDQIEADSRRVLVRPFTREELLHTVKTLEIATTS
jgi:DNA-binding response OmpR family regulator